MAKFSWWHVAVGATVLALAVVAAGDFADAPGATIGAWACLAALGGGYVVFGWRSFQTSNTTGNGGGTGSAVQAADVSDDTRAKRESAGALAFPLLAIACTSVGVAFDPNLAILQAVTFPIIWFSVDPLRRAIVLNVLLALGVTAGFIVYGGASARNILQSVAIETISLLFSLALGLWFSFALKQGQENTRLLGELRAAQDELATLNRDSGILSERERLAGEIHDTIAQSLTALVMTAQRTRSQLPDDLTDPRENLVLIEEIARDALVETRALVAATAAVDANGGLIAALERLFARFSRETSVSITLDAARYAAQSNDVEVVLLRATQEALANVRKHSGASAVSVLLEVDGEVSPRDGSDPHEGSRPELGWGIGSGTASPAPPDVRLVVSDDGSGIDRAKPLNDGFGLAGLQQRLAIVGGSLTVGSSNSGGAELTVTLPAATLTPATLAGSTSISATSDSASAGVETSTTGAAS